MEQIGRGNLGGGHKMKKNAEILGLKVISIAEGKELGVVKELVINPAGGTVAALVVDDGEWFYGAKVLPFMAIVGIGEYAVMVESSDHLASVAATPEIVNLLNVGVKVIGAKVLTKSGRIQGKISEYTVDAAGKIIACELELANGSGSAQLSSEYILTFGKDVIIVAEQDPA
jgi:uncharacterized protein YrrD